LGWKVCFVIGAVRDPLHPASGLGSATPGGTQTRLALVSASARSSSGG
jgi:hypothetical protein